MEHYVQNSRFKVSDMCFCHSTPSVLDFLSAAVNPLMSLLRFPLWALLYVWWHSYHRKVWGSKDRQSMQTNEYKWEISLSLHFLLLSLSLYFQTAALSVTAQCLHHHCWLAGQTLLTKHRHFQIQQLTAKEILNYCLHRYIEPASCLVVI